MLCGWGVKTDLFAGKTVLPYLSALENAFGIRKRFTNVQVKFGAQVHSQVSNLTEIGEG